MKLKYFLPNRHMFKDFRDFALKGSVLDMAVGIIIGAAFGTIVKSLVDDIIMPPIGLLLGKIDFSNLFVVIKETANVGGVQVFTPEDAKKLGWVTINYGRFINNIISFLIVAFSIFMMIRVFTAAQKEEDSVQIVEPTEKECPYCYSKIHIQATKCPNCTSSIPLS